MPYPFCPRCGRDYGRCLCAETPELAFTPDQQRYIDRILADSAAVYAQEAREFNARRAAA